MELSILHAVQSIANPVLDVLFEAITILGEQTVVILALAACYWLYDKKFGEEFAFTLLLSGLVNCVIKGIVKAPRPIGEPGVRTLRAHTATGYSFPSGHSQNAGTLYFFLAKKMGGKKWYILSAATCLLIGVSRLYLGVHWPSDVVVGLTLGIAMVWICPILWEKFDHEKLLCVLSLLLLPVTVLIGQENLWKNYGMLVGLWLGMVFEHRFVNYEVKTSWPRRILRFVLGMALVLGVKEGLKPILPDHMIFDGVRYGMMAFMALGLYPWIFKKMKC